MPDESDTPFFQAMQQARSAAEEFTKMFAAVKLPAAPDLEALLAAHRRNMEALTAANRVALEGAQTVARRQAEIMQQTMAEFAEALHALTAAEPPQAKAARQAELLRRAYELAVANARELTELIQRSSGEAVGLLSARFAEAMDEVKALVEKARHAG